MNNRLRMLIASAALLVSSAAVAQTWPNRPVQFIVPSAAGSGPDVTLRYYTDRIAKSIGQPIVVFNRPGAQQAVCSSPNVSPSTPSSSSCLWFSGSGCRESLELSCRSQCSRCPKLFAIECAFGRFLEG